MRYPYKCTRCGYCCLSTPCPIIKFLIPDVEQCPFFDLDREGVAYCHLVYLGVVPKGDGCCIKARCFRGNDVYDFAALPPEIKRDLALNLKRRNNEQNKNQMDQKTFQG